VRAAAIAMVLLVSVAALASLPAAAAVPSAFPGRVIAGRMPAQAASPAAGGLASTALPPVPGHYRPVAVPGAAVTIPEDINDPGVIVGCFQRSAGGATFGFTDRRGRFTTITDPATGHRSPVRACVLGANSRGVLVGYYQSASGADHAFRDSHGRFSPIRPPGASGGAVAVDISDSGAIVGYYWSRHRAVEHDFELKAGRFRSVRDPAAHGHLTGSWLGGVADSGTVVGGYVTRSVDHGFLDSSGRFTAIAVPGAARRGGKGTAPGCISKLSGLVVGTYARPNSAHASGFAYLRGRYWSVSDPAGTEGTSPQCVNDSGQIVGVYYGRGLRERGFLFTPRH
jgi:hypothetical protein